MAQVSPTSHPELDTSSLDVLLQELVGDLPPQVSDLLKNKYLHSQVVQYLHDVSSIGSSDYLSSVPPTPGMDVQEERTLVQDIAELEAQQRSVDSKLKSVIVGSQQLIIDNKTGLSHDKALFTNDFSANLKSLWRTFNEDDLEDMNEPQDLDLQELEADLEPDDKDKTFRTIVSNVKKLVEAESQDRLNKNLSIVLENMEQIISILELPSLTGTCIKAGYYSEALEISSYTRRLAIRFPNSDLIKEVEAGIKTEMSHMLIGLIRLLRTNLKQSSIIKIVSYLRRIQPFSQSSDADEQLKRILLHARYQFIKFELDSLTPLKESELHEKYLKRSIEVIREHCFGSIMAFKNIFPDINDNEFGQVEIDIEEDEKTEETSNAEDEPAVEKKSESPNGGEASNDEADTEVFDASETSKDKALPEVSSEEKATPETEGTDVAEEELKTESATTEKTEKSEPESAPQEVPVPVAPVQFIRPSSERSASNLLLFEFVRHILHELSAVLAVSLSNIQETSTRDGLYLQLIYCSHSLARIDQNFSDLMTAVLLNSKDERGFLIDRAAWVSAVEKQKQLAQNLSSRG